MKRKITWLIVSCLVIALVSGSCASGVTKEEDVVSPEEEEVTGEEPTAVSPLEPPGTYTDMSNQIAGIDVSSNSSLANLLGAALDIENAKAESTVSGTEADNLDNQLTIQFSSWIRETVDAIDPAIPESIKDFFDLQAVQRTSEYNEFVDPETKTYKEEQMADKFNEWVRNRVDEIDPSSQGALKDMFDLQVIQRTGKYDELTTADTHSYKEEQMGEKLNEWVRNRVDEIDPTDPNSLKYFFWMQKVQANEKYDRFATPETHEYKEQQMKQKFNEWVENRVNDLDPNDPDFLKNLEMLRVIQRSDKYDMFITTLMHEWKERTLKDKMADYVSNLVNGLDPSLPTFWKDLSDLKNFQLSDIYDELCPETTKQDIEAQVNGLLEPGLPGLPKVLGIYPEDGQADVPWDQSIMIVFNTSMVVRSLESAIEVSPEIRFDVFPPLGSTKIVLLHPFKPLRESTTYTITIDSKARSSSVPSEAEPWIVDHLRETCEFSFTTKEPGPAPNVIATTPEDGTIDSMAGQPITIRFDQSMSTTSVESAISIVPAFDYSVVWTDDNTVILQSHVPLDVNTDYVVTIDTSAMSSDSVPLREEYQSSFTTGIMNLPQVLGALPYSEQGNIPSNHPIQIVFDRSMDRKSVEALLNISPNYGKSISWFEAEMVLEINPSASLLANTTYTITISAGALSSFGLPLEDDYEFSFTTRS